MKHHPHTLVFFSQQQSPAISLAAKGHLAGGAAVDPHFLLDSRADDIVGAAQTAVVIDPDFGDQEKGYTCGALRRPFNSGQNRMNDVFRQVMIARCDEDFIAAQGISAVRIFDG